MLDNEKIFIQIAAYRDNELLPTLKDCIKKAKHPENTLIIPVYLFLNQIS